MRDAASHVGVVPHIAPLMRATIVLRSLRVFASGAKQSIVRRTRKDGLLRCARNDGDIVSRSRDMMCPRFASRLPPKHEGAGKTGCVPHPRSRVPFALWQKMHTSIQVRRKHPGLPCAMDLRLASCSSRRTAVLPPSPARLHAGLTPAPRRRNHTTSPYASGAIVYRAICVHRISPRVRDDGQRPSSCSETNGLMRLICVDTKAEYFCANDWTDFG